MLSLVSMIDLDNFPEIQNCDHLLLSRIYLELHSSRKVALVIGCIA
ncbi:hypothetical protein IM45_246 [Candidatus Palibaumannia cicadellinicola]|uniref:Uncharacterized protein n=1 Tax=Candidatus Palibaumannia cicadellinicola TaxID=186490 RepID=A0A088N0X7_9GAMM|nr:hypothetical protein IM45_246 [Candidatus Baumannia cicadellinicola]